MEEINQIGTGTGFAEALFEGFAGFACAGGGGGGYFLNAGDFGDDNIGLKLKFQIYAVQWLSSCRLEHPGKFRIAEK